MTRSKYATDSRGEPVTECEDASLCEKCDTRAATRQDARDVYWCEECWATRWDDDRR